MAHVKAGSSSANQKANVVGKRRGLKVNDGQMVNGGQILVRQTGVIYHPGSNTKLARDHSLISLIVGRVKFGYIRRPNGLKTVVNILPEVVAEVKTPEKAEKKAPKAK
jgi:large subunit ribosomal protein L27